MNNNPFKEITTEELLNKIIDNSNLNNSEILLFKSYVLKYNSNYTKMAVELNSSRFIVRKELATIMNKLFKSYLKIKYNDN